MSTGKRKERDHSSGRDFSGSRSSNNSLAASDKQIHDSIFRQCILPDYEIVEIQEVASEEFDAFRVPKVFSTSSATPYTSERQYAIDVFSEIIEGEIKEVIAIVIIFVTKF